MTTFHPMCQEKDLRIPVGMLNDRHKARSFGAAGLGGREVGAMNKAVVLYIYIWVENHRKTIGKPYL